MDRGRRHWKCSDCRIHSGDLCKSSLARSQHALCVCAWCVLYMYFPLLSTQTALGFATKFCVSFGVCTAADWLAGWMACLLMLDVVFFHFPSCSNAIYPLWLLGTLLPKLLLLSLIDVDIDIVPRFIVVAVAAATAVVVVVAIVFVCCFWPFVFSLLYIIYLSKLSNSISYAR